MSEPSALDRTAWQPALFAERLSRFALLKLRAAPYEDAPVLSVLRNHAFEPVASALPAFLRFADVPMRLQLGAYDDSLVIPEAAAGAHLVWLDFTRYPKLSDTELEAWLLDRLDALRAVSAAPIIVANAPEGDDRAAHLNAALAGWAAATPGRPSCPWTAWRHVKVPASSTRPAPRRRNPPVGRGRLGDRTASGPGTAGGFLRAAGQGLRPDLDNTLYEGVLGRTVWPACGSPRAISRSSASWRNGPAGASC
uniref:Uncharacterized protein n=1 Tax=Phenylobacterium glaciei TaxID=2803784 RepID=A0A974P563_9CAUL|nr:hypothetical protein JKL49_10530 [Phenylobacterium glaciei]